MDKKIYFSLSTGWALRNFVSNGVVAGLSRNFQVHLIYPSKFSNFISEHCKSLDVARTSYDVGKEPISWRLLRQARKKIYLDARDSATEKIWHVYGKRPLYKIVGACWIRFVVKIFGTSRVSAWLESADMLFNRRSSADAIFAGNATDCVFIATHASTYYDESLHRAAIDSGARTALLVLSWDHLSSKIVIGFNFDKLFVWNNVSKSEILHTLPSYDDTCIGIVGAPQFDAYAEKPSLSYREWCRSVGLDDSHGFILFSTMPQVRHDGQHRILELLGRAIKRDSTRFSNLQILVKPHPFDDRSLYQPLEDAGFIKLLPSESDGKGLPEDWLPSRDAAVATRDALYFCQLNVNIFSTMTLEAAYFDKPIIHIAFDLPGQTNPIPCRKYYDFEHFRPIVESGCSVLVEDFDSLLDAIVDAVDKPERRSPQRRKVVESYFGIAPGHSGSTLIDEISRMVERS